MKGGGGGGGGVVVSAGPEGCSSSSWLASNSPWLVETFRRSTQLRLVFVICGWATPPLRALDIKHVMNDTRPSPGFTALPHRSVYYSQCKPKNRKKGRPGNEASLNVSCIVDILM